MISGSEQTEGLPAGENPLRDVQALQHSINTELQSRDSLMNELRALGEAKETLKENLRIKETNYENLQRKFEELQEDLNSMTSLCFEDRTKVWSIARIRPRLDTDANDSPTLDIAPAVDDRYALVVPGTVEPLTSKKTVKNAQIFHFDRICDQYVDNHGLWRYISPMFRSFKGGYDVGICLDGPSGSGKTYTLFAKHGIVESMIRNIYDPSSQNSEGLQVYFSSWEVLGTGIWDHTSETPEKIDPVSKGFKYKENLAPDSKSLRIMFARARKHNSIASTIKNPVSSRGFAVYRIKLKITEEAGTRQSSLWLIDLAGAEPGETFITPTRNDFRQLLKAAHNGSVARIQQKLKSATKEDEIENLERYLAEKIQKEIQGHCKPDKVSTLPTCNILRDHGWRTYI